MRDFRKLEVWKKAHKFVLEIYTISSGFPKEENYGIIRFSLHIKFHILS